MKTLSMLGNDAHTDEQVVGYYNVGERMKRWGVIGAFRGPILVAGPLVVLIVAALEGTVVVGGVSAIRAGLASIGISKDSILKYEVALKADKFLLIVHGSPRAKAIFAGTRQSSILGESVV